MLRTIIDIENILVQANAKFEILKHPTPIISVNDAKKYFDTQKAAPTFIVKTESGLVAMIVSAQRGRLDFKHLKDKLGFAKLKLADKTTIFESTGCTVGSIPLIGHGLPCIFDDKLLAFDYVYGGTGDALFTLKINPYDLKRLNQVIAVLK